MSMTGNKILNNAKWILICRVAQALLQLLIGMLSARYLGPANYGLINYAASVVAFVMPIMQLGLPSTLIQELIEMPDKEGEIMGTAVVMDIISSLACMLLVYTFVSTMNHGETETMIVCILYSLSLVFRAMELMQCWFQSKLQSKYPSLVALCAYVIVSAYRIYLLVTNKSIYWFAVVNSVDYGIIGISLILIYWKLGTQKLSFSFRTVKRLFSRSKYYILASMMVTVFQNTDHIMLKTMYGDAENGFYSAAITSAGVCQFVYQAIIDSTRPVILAGKKAGSSDYEKNISRLYCITVYMALVQGVGFTVFAKLIVRILYGEQYFATISVLRILVWYIAFCFMGAIRNIWILAEGKQRLVWRLNLAGALLNIAVNYVLIPVWGACGAAVASLGTQIFTNFVLGFLIKDLRKNNRLLLKGLDPRLLLEMLQSQLIKRKEA